MRRALFAVVAGLMIVALVAPIAAAKPAISFVAKASAGAPGGQLHVMAKVKHPVRGSTFSATATVHFGGITGDVTVDLNRHGGSFVAGAKVAIPADQPLGMVVVDVTITYNSVANPVPPFNAMIEPDTTE